MAETSIGFIVITDQGDPEHGRPVKYLQVQFPGSGKELLRHHLYQTSDMHNCTVFKLERQGHRMALELADRVFPQAVPVRVRVTRIIDVLMEIPDASLDLDC